MFNKFNIDFKELSKIILKLIIFVIFIVTLTFLIEAITRNSFSEAKLFFNNQTKRFAVNLSIVGLTLIPFLIFKKRIFYYTLISIIWIILSFANSSVLTLRGTPLTASDITMLDTAITLIDQYFTKSQVIIMLLLFVVVISLLVVLYIKIKKTAINYLLVVPTIITYIIGFLFCYNYSLNNKIVDGNFWDITAKYKEYGFAYSFSYSVVNNGIERPSDYNKNTIASMVDDITINNNETAETYLQTSQNNMDSDSNKNSNINTEMYPNIILVQLESFIDPAWIKDMEFNKDPIPNFRNITENFSSGLLSVPSLGGGTSNTEFEVITGFSLDYFGVGEFPYNTVVSSKAVPSLAISLRDIGYSTHALHNHEGHFYSRNSVYKNLGFNDFTPIETMAMPERTKVGWSKDFILTSEIEKLMTSTENSDLVFAVSVQGHGNYPSIDLDNKEISITNDYKFGNKNSLEYYLNQIHEMDKFIGELIAMVNNLKEPTIIAFYGDHFPALGIPNNSFITDSLKVTPYTIWNNLGLLQENIDIEAYELTSKILSSAGIPQNTISLLHNSDLSTEEKNKYLHLLEYDLISGKGYANNEKSSIYKDFSFGINTPLIDTYKIDGDRCIISGSNFNNFSKAFINGKQIDTTFIDEQNLSIPASQISVGDSVQVKQIAVKSSKELLKSNIHK